MILVVMAHPDDEILGAGGTIARLVAEGRIVSWLLLSSGVGARSNHDPSERLRSCETAARTLGVHDVVVHDLPDNRFDSVDLLDVTRLVEEAVDRTEPDTVLTHHGGDLNVDHRVTHKAVLTATRPTPQCSVRTVLGAEIPSSTEWAFDAVAPFTPSVFIDISSTIETKLAAFAAYMDEVRPAPHPRSSESLRALATVRGAAAGVPAAEAFELLRALR